MLPGKSYVIVLTSNPRHKIRLLASPKSYKENKRKKGKEKEKERKKKVSEPAAVVLLTVAGNFPYDSFQKKTRF